MPKKQREGRKQSTRESTKGMEQRTGACVHMWVSARRKKSWKHISNSIHIGSVKLSIKLFTYLFCVPSLYSLLTWFALVACSPNKSRSWLRGWFAERFLAVLCLFVLPSEARRFNEQKWVPDSPPNTCLFTSLEWKIGSEIVEHLIRWALSILRYAWFI